MNRHAHEREEHQGRITRVSGDEPDGYELGRIRYPYSPRERG